MINWLLSRIYRPERGWDPVPEDHAIAYAAGEWESGVKQQLIDSLDEWLGGLAGKRILDLGGGPGQYSVAFAKRGAHVTWYDVSHRYRAIAEQKAEEANVSIRFVIGYLDEAPVVLGDTYDFVFNRICWYYSFGDASFARALYGLVAPGGSAYVDANIDCFKAESLSLTAKVKTFLNSSFCIKIGHPHPPRGRIARCLLQYPVDKMLINYQSLSGNDRVLFRKTAKESIWA